jgi:type I restriction enzyme, S subunit
MTSKTVLKSLINLSKDGEWGKGDEFTESIKMGVIRGTDFKDISFGDIRNLPQRFIPKHIAEAKRLCTGDIIIETAGGSKDRPTGRTLFIKETTIARSILPLTCASFSRFIRIDRNKADPRFVFYLLQHMYQSGCIRKYNTQHTGVARFQWTLFAENEELHLPPFETQKKIVSILSAYDDLIENNNRRITILERMAKLVYDEWFVKYMFTGHEKVEMIESEIGEIPNGWEVKKVSDLLDRQKAGEKYTQDNVFDEGLVPVIDQSQDDILGFHNGEADHNASPEKPVMMFGDHTCKIRILVEPFSVGPNVIPFVSKGYPEIFIYFLIRNLVETKDYKRHWNELIVKKVIVPDKGLAKDFADRATPLFQQISLLEKKNHNLRQTRDLLLPRLISRAIS